MQLLFIEAIYSAGAWSMLCACVLHICNANMHTYLVSLGAKFRFKLVEQVSSYNIACAKCGYKKVVSCRL